MGQAFDKNGHLLGGEFGETKREVFDKLIERFPDAAWIDIRTLKERVLAAEREQNAAQKEMPRYQSHKIVHALKIRDVMLDTVLADGSAIIQPADEGYGTFRVSAKYVHKHDPQGGGYYVVYEDGYESFSPAEAFESGYMRI